MFVVYDRVECEIVWMVGLKLYYLEPRLEFFELF